MVYDVRDHEADLESGRNTSPKWVNVYMRTDARASKVRSDISDRSNLQWELRTLIFFPNDDGNQKPGPGSPNIPPFRYGKIEFPDEGHQERLDLCEAAMWLNKYSRLYN